MLTLDDCARRDQGIVQPLIISLAMTMRDVTIRLRMR
jgi:hypothetical protein